MKKVLFRERSTEYVYRRLLTKKRTAREIFHLIHMTCKVKKDVIRTHMRIMSHAVSLAFLKEMRLTAYLKTRDTEISHIILGQAVQEMIWSIMLISVQKLKLKN